MKKIKVIFSITIFTLLITGIVFVYQKIENNSIKIGNYSISINKIESKTVHIGSFFTAIDYAPYLVAKNKNWFEEDLKTQKVDVEYTTFQSLPTINESFATDRIDIVFEAEPPAIIGRSADIDIRIIGISCTLTQEIIVPHDSIVQSINDLKNKKIAVLAGTSSHYGLFKIARAANLKDDDISVINMMPPDAKIAFESGHVDAWAVWPPFVEQEIINGRGRVLPSSEAQIHSIMAIRGVFADQYPDIANTILKTLERSKLWIQSNPEEAKQIVANVLGLDIKVVEMAWPKHIWNAQLSEEVIIDIQEKSNFLKNLGVIKKDVNVKKDLIQSINISPKESKEEQNLEPDYAFL